MTLCRADQRTRASIPRAIGADGKASASVQFVWAPKWSRVAFEISEIACISPRCTKLCASVICYAWPTQLIKCDSHAGGDCNAFC